MLNRRGKPSLQVQEIDLAQEEKVENAINQILEYYPSFKSNHAFFLSYPLRELYKAGILEDSVIHMLAHACQISKNDFATADLGKALEKLNEKEVLTRLTLHATFLLLEADLLDPEHHLLFNTHDREEADNIAHAIIEADFNWLSRSINRVMESLAFLHHARISNVHYVKAVFRLLKSPYLAILLPDALEALFEKDILTPPNFEKFLRCSPKKLQHFCRELIRNRPLDQAKFDLIAFPIQPSPHRYFTLPRERKSTENPITKVPSLN